MNPDGISYLDVAEAYRSGDFRGAINGYWSPFYSWILAIVALRPDVPALQEFALAHLVNFFSFVASLIAFDFFLEESFKCVVARPPVPARTTTRHLTKTEWQIIGYCLFAESSLKLISLRVVTPDLLVAAFVYVASALLLRLSRNAGGLGSVILLGVTLAASSLAKSALFPLSFVFIGIAFILLLRLTPLRAAIGRFAALVAVFVVLTGPFIATLSHAKGRVMFGDAGRLTYLWFVNDLQHDYWQGGDDAGTPIHPARQVLDEPRVYEFATPLRGTYPLWYDASYWNEGANANFHFGRQTAALFKNLKGYFETYIALVPVITLVIVLLLLGELEWRSGLQWLVAISGVAAFTMYALVYTETRYTGAFFVSTCMIALASVTARTARGRRLLLALGAALAVPAFGIAFARFATDGIIAASQPGDRPQSDSVAATITIAAALVDAGTKKGSAIGLIGDGYSAYWARLARLRIISETPATAALWLSEPKRRAVLSAMRRAGAEFVVAEQVPDGAPLVGWIPLGRHTAMIRVDTIAIPATAPTR